ncbi:acyltransferase [Brachybacterium sp.]|uniref:acyltransferase n=1 Tax=Brachybacterium sp. TaxID=1891286 RepID=UPI002ED3C3CF
MTSDAAASSGVASPGAGGRVPWLDLARAFAIVLVVVYHVAGGAGYDLLPRDSTGAGYWWSAVNIMLAPIPMNLFFMVSGMLALRAVRRPWSLVLRPRVLDMLWPYLLWSLVFALTAWVRYAPEDPWGFALDQVTAMVVVMGPYWFVAVLPLFFLAARLGRNRPRLLLALAVIVYVLAVPLRLAMLDAPWIPVLITEGFYRCTVYALWYLAGFVLREQIIAIATRTPAWAAGLLLVVFVLSTSVMFFGQYSHLVERILHAIASLSGVLGPVTLMPALVRIPWIARLGGAIGSRTLEIYMIHPLVLNAVVVLYPASAPGRALAGSLLSDLLLIPLVSAVALGAGVLAQILAQRWHLGWLFSAPGGGRPRDIPARAPA